MCVRERELENVSVRETDRATYRQRIYLNLHREAAVGAGDKLGNRDVVPAAHRVPVVRQRLRRFAPADHMVSSRLLGPVDPSFRAISGRLKFTVRRHKANKDCGALLLQTATADLGPKSPIRCRANLEQISQIMSWT